MNTNEHEWVREPRMAKIRGGGDTDEHEYALARRALVPPTSRSRPARPNPEENNRRNHSNLCSDPLEQAEARGIFFGMKAMLNLTVAILVCAAGGCNSRYPKVAFMPYRHVIVLDMKEPVNSREFGNDFFQMCFVPGVVNVLTGPGIPTGEEGELACSWGVIMDIQDANACQHLPEHPTYKALMDKWRQRANAVHVASFGLRCEEPEGK